MESKDETPIRHASSVTPREDDDDDDNDNNNDNNNPAVRGADSTLEAPKDGPPDGGIAWVTVFASFLLFVITWGPSITFGLFQQYYETTFLRRYAASDISWIGALNAFFLITTGVVAGPFFDRGYLRQLMTLGCLMAVLGMMMLSLATEYYQIMLSLGVCFGIGSGLVYVPALAFVNVNFSTKRGVAMGLVTLGASVGGLIFPIIFLQLEPRIGYPWTVRVFGFIMLALSITALCLLFVGRSPPKPAKPRGLVDWPALKDPVFLADGLANFFVFMAYFVPIFYVPTFSQAYLGNTVQTAYYQLATLNAASAVGRLGAAFLSRRLGAVNLLLAAVVSSMILLFGWMGVTTSAGLWLWAVLFGVCSGTLISSNPVVMAHPVISPTPAVIGTRLGMQWVFTGTGVLIGAPIGGSLLSKATTPRAHATREAFLKLEGFTAAMMAGGLLFIMVPVVAIWRYPKAR